MRKAGSKKVPGSSFGRNPNSGLGPGTFQLPALFWQPTDPVGRRWELSIRDGKRWRFVGRVFRERPGKVVAGFFTGKDARGNPRHWKDHPVATMAAGGRRLIGQALPSPHSR